MTTPRKPPRHRPHKREYLPKTKVKVLAVISTPLCVTSLAVAAPAAINDNAKAEIGQISTDLTPNRQSGSKQASVFYPERIAGAARQNATQHA